MIKWTCLSPRVLAHVRCKTNNNIYCLTLLFTYFMHIVWISSDIILRFILMQRSLNYWRLVIVLEKHHAFKRYNMLPCQKKTRENTKLNEVAILVLWEVLKRENISVARFFLQLVWQNGEDEKGYKRQKPNFSGWAKETNKSNYISAEIKEGKNK